MQDSFSDEHRRVSGSWLSVPQGKDSLKKSDWCFVSLERSGTFNPFVSVTQRFLVWKKKDPFSQITANHRDLLPCSSLLLAFKLSHSYRGIKRLLDLFHVNVRLSVMWCSPINIMKHFYGRAKFINIIKKTWAECFLNRRIIKKGQQSRQ